MKYEIYFDDICYADVGKGRQRAGLNAWGCSAEQTHPRFHTSTSGVEVRLPRLQTCKSRSGERTRTLYFSLPAELLGFSLSADSCYLISTAYRERTRISTVLPRSDS